MKKILVTGAAGLLGANICFLLRDRYQIFALDTNKIDIQSVTSFTGSALDVALIEQLLQKEHIDVLFHCAAITDMDRCEKEYNYAYLVNQLLPKNLSYLCSKHAVKLVFISSDSVYCGSKLGLHPETDSLEPLSIYAKTKLGAEEHVLTDSRNLVVRTNMFGFNYRDKRSFGEWVVQSLQNNETLNMFYDIEFSPLFVNDLVAILDSCIQQDLFGLYNVGSRKPISKYDLGVTIQQVFALPGFVNKASMTDFSYVAPRTKNMSLDVQKIEQTLGVRLPTPQEAVEHFYESYQNGYSRMLKEGRKS